jgi:hypothetical protein
MSAEILRAEGRFAQLSTATSREIKSSPEAAHRSSAAAIQSAIFGASALAGRLVSDGKKLSFLAR